MSRIAPCLLLLVACSADPSPAPITPAVPASRPAKVQPVETFAGVITSHESKLVTAEVDGRIDQLLVQPGQRVTANTPLAILNPGEVQKSLDAARGQEEAALGELRRSESQRAEASRQLRQYRALLRDGAVSRDQVASAQTAYVVADAQVQTARGAVTRNRASREQIEEQLVKTTIVAPIDGVITLVKVSEGQMAGRGQPIARIFDPSDLRVRFEVPLQRRDSIEPGTRVSASLVIDSSRQLSATVLVVHRTLEPSLPLAVAEADLDDAAIVDRESLVGAMVDVRFE